MRHTQSAHLEHRLGRQAGDTACLQRRAKLVFGQLSDSTFEPKVAAPQRSVFEGSSGGGMSSDWS